MGSHIAREVILISDDEDSSGHRAGNRRPRPTSISSNSSLGDRNSDFLKAIPQPRIDRIRRHSTKRFKSETDNKDAVPITYSRPGPPTDYTKVKLTFPGRHHNDSRASFGFYNLQPINNSTNERHDPCALQMLDDEVVRSKNRLTASRERENECPYYYDTKLEVKMFRGRGYKRFPVVFGTVKGHKAICDKWDAEQMETRRDQEVRGQRTFSSDDQILLSTNPFTFASSSGAAAAERECLREVLTIFPQIQHKFVRDKCQALRTRFEAAIGQDVQELAPSAEIIAEIADLETYPKEEALQNSEVLTPLPEDETGITITWNKDIPKSEIYTKEAIKLLAAEFSHVPTINISKIVKQKKSLFDTYVYFAEAEASYYDNGIRPYPRSRAPRIVLEKKYSKGYSEPRDGHLYVNLVNELQAAKQKVARDEAHTNKLREKEEIEANNLAIYKTDGALVECQCCFDDEIPMNRATSCDGEVGHFFCYGCIMRLAESQVGSMKYEMSCMDPSGCKSVLSVEGVSQAITTRLFDKLAFYQQQAEISAADIEGLEQCPHCEFKAICDLIEVDSVFICQNTDCGRSTCRKCHEDTHLPKTCEEAKGDKGLSARHLVEEARSEAMIRQCPKCKAKIIKELGCNKMMCSCGCIMCYVCKANISGGKEGGYHHFHQTGAKCPLYDTAGTERHDEDADAAEKEAIKKVKANDQYQDIDEKLLQVETGAGKDKNKQKTGQPPHAVNMRHAFAPDFDMLAARAIDDVDFRPVAAIMRDQEQEQEPLMNLQRERHRNAMDEQIVAQVQHNRRQMHGQGFPARTDNPHHDPYRPDPFYMPDAPNELGGPMMGFDHEYHAFVPDMYIPAAPAFVMPNMPNFADLPREVRGFIGGIQQPNQLQAMPPPLLQDGGVMERMERMERERWFQHMQEYFQRQRH